MHNLSSGLDIEGFGKPMAVGMLWEAWQGSFCRDSFSFPTVEEDEGSFPCLTQGSGRLGLSPKGRGSPRWVPGPHRGSVKASRVGREGPSSYSS